MTCEKSTRFGGHEVAIAPPVSMKKNVGQFLADHGVSFLGGSWVIHYDGGDRMYADLRELMKREMLVWFLPVYWLGWGDVEDFIKDKM